MDVDKKKNKNKLIKEADPLIQIEEISIATNNLLQADLSPD
jgi:hypothetical protein